MKEESIVVKECLKKILKIAGIYQADDDIGKAKENVMKALSLVTNAERDNPTVQIKNWNMLCELLDSYFRGSNDPKWLTLIRFAKSRAISRRSGASNRHKLKSFTRDDV